MEDESAGARSPFVLLNLLCLDAPLVAVSWAWLFALTSAIAVPHGGMVALFLSAWLIYLADRFGDSRWSPKDAPTSLRQRFCLRHRTLWLAIMIVAAAADLFVVATRIESRIFLNGVSVGVFALGYLILNRARPVLWRRLPMKEVCIGFLFAAGVVVPLGFGLTNMAWLLFACLCSLNCASIALWERDLDQSQGRISIATELPKMSRWLTPALFLLAAVCGARALSGLGLVYACLSASALLLAIVNLCRDAIPSDTRTALADLVLLTPLALLLVRFATRLAGA